MNEETVNFDQAQVEEGKVVPLKVTKEKVIILSPQFRDALVAYLSAKPYREVRDLLVNLESLAPIEITFNAPES